MISKSALDIAALLRSVRGKAAKPSAPSLDAYYRKVLSTADPQYAKRLGVLLNNKLTSVTKTAELDSSVALPASAALLGASGIVFMMIVLSSFTEMKKDGIPVTLILVVIFYLGGEIMDGIRGSDSISQLTHIVGGICGLVFGFSIKGRKR